MHTSILLTILQLTCPRPLQSHNLSDVEITVLNTWEAAFASDIQDIAWQADAGQIILRSNEDGLLYICDGNLSVVDEIELPAGLDGFGVGYNMENDMYYVNSGSAPTIYYSDGSDSWTGFTNPAGIQGAGLDVENFFYSDYLCQVTTGSPCLLWLTDTDDFTSESFVLSGIDGEVSGMMGHEIMAGDGWEPGALIVTTRYGCEFYFYYEQSSSYVLYDQEDCPLDVQESLGLAWKFSEFTVLWSWKGTDGKYYVSELYIPVFGGGIEDDMASSSSGGLLGILANPSRSGAVLKVNLPEQDDFVLEVFDLSGRLVETIHRGSMAGGEHLFGFDAPAGIYAARLSRPSGREILRFALTE
jgi:hypothetical protein